jgi:DNA polymerase III subunit epsilon
MDAPAHYGPAAGRPLRAVLGRAADAGAPAAADPLAARVRRIARAWVARRPLYLDTETTGLGAADEVVELAVIEHDGSVLVNARFQPLRPIPPAATRVHGIGDRDVFRCPPWSALAGEIARSLAGRYVVIYNAAFDLRLMAQTARLHGCAPPLTAACCAMKLYAAHVGERDDLRGGYRWHKLSAAAAQLGIEVPADLHSARADAVLTRAVVEGLAGGGVHTGD